MGAEHKGPPLPLDNIGQAMKDTAGESYGLEITGRKSERGRSDRGSEQGEENEIACCSDDTLKERIQTYENLRKSIVGGRTKDKGEKLERKLGQLYTEREKRKQQSKAVETCIKANNGEQFFIKGDQLTYNNFTGKHSAALSCRDMQTRNQESGHKQSAFSDDLGILKGTCININPKNGSIGKEYSNDKLPGDTKCQIQKRNSSETVPSSSFYTKSGELSYKSKKHLENGKPSNEAEISIASRIASGKRNRPMSPRKQRDALGPSQPDLSRQLRKTTMSESVSHQQSRLLPGTHSHKDSLGASLDTAMELSDDEERKGLQDVKDGFEHAKDLLAHRYPLRSDSGRKEGFRVTYPSGDPEAVEVQQSDLKHLEAYEFLNDTVIDFYIKYLQRPESLSKEKKADFHFFNTFFYKKLLLEKRKRKKGDSYYSKLRKWTKGINIFEKKHLLVPIHDSAHWSLAIICFAMDHREKVVLTPHILHLDSMKEGHVSEEIFHVLKSYLEAEWNHVRGLDGSCRIVLKDIFCKRVEVPLQQNAWDCGLFLLYFIECFLRDANKFDPQSLDSMFGRRWFRPQDASNLRRLIKNLLEDLIEPVNDEIMMEDMD